jgi:hypothetical protein
MRHAGEVRPVGPDLDGTPLGLDLVELCRPHQAMLVELRLDEAEREARPPDLGDLHLPHQVRQRAHVILVRVREDDRPNVLRALSKHSEVR